MLQNYQGEEMNKRNRSIFVSVIAIIALACACPGTALPGTDQPPATFAPISTIPPIVPTDEVAPPPPADALLADDFSVDTGEWELYSEDAAIAEVQNGVYVVRSTGDTWAWGGGVTNLTDVVIDVDVTLAEGPSNYNVGLGVMCRLSEAADGSISGYIFAISADAFYYIGSIDGGSITALVDWTSSDTVNLGYETNKMRVTCNGDNLTLEVNGELLGTASAVAGGPTNGSVGFTATSYESENGDPIAEGHFDNLVVTAP